ncbi:indolepyruvate oxidoreductase subunit beta family protein [Salinarimonas rosea]|uniref:indolepyruvate oxidoreductase subunit beta family protein n=1 Tax=Salinarimonas rosea TaxID=552063 RepID=UPI0003FE6BC5|nr:indolepyruvate oxidoreductase subunit beta family protein [Salinarimonas rosea]
MTRHETFAQALSTDRPITIAILAMGGQGGGVLADWIVGMAEAQGWTAQSTSVPGVAQRTGATIYYIEMVEAPDGAVPILALMPTPGDVDVVLAAEFMEAGRSILRGLVTPDRTTLIASTHRSYAVAEKQKPGDGAADPQAVVRAARVASKRVIASDLDALAARHGSVISAALFGSLAGADVLPFPREAFEGAIRAGGKGVSASLAAFSAAFDRARHPEAHAEAHAEPPAPAKPDPLGDVGHAGYDALLARVRADFPAEAQPLLAAGLRKVVDFQDLAYGGAYLDRMRDLLAADRAAGGAAQGHAFGTACAKYLAVAMAYDDVIRVADLKTRASRHERVSREVGVKGEEILYTTEFMHPRMEEVIGTMPARLGRWLEARPGLVRRLDRVVSRGRRVRTGTIRWYLTLYAVAGLKRMRLKTLRHSRETAHIDAWLGRALEVLPRNYALAVEMVGCRRLVKGYSGTHARGEAKFDRVLSAVPLLVAREDGADWLRRLKQAALMDEEGTALDGALRTVQSLAD